MITENIFETVLIEPARAGAGELLIIAGYATPAMALYHFDRLRQYDLRIKVDLIIGMTRQEGIPPSNHAGFRKLALEEPEDRFACRYICRGAPIHAKVYIWRRNGIPHLAFVGSPNYSQSAFLSNQREALSPSDPEAAKQYFESLLPDTINCTDEEADRLINTHITKEYHLRQEIHRQIDELPGVRAEWYGLQKADISFLARNGTLPARSGLNWGQRPELNREPNQAYIRVPADIARSGFFPPQGVYFTVLTDEGKSFVCARAQAGGKGIHTPRNNSELGRYFRDRLGLRSGEFITKEHLLKYGRTDVSFYKKDDETYYMDFSVGHG